MKVLHNFLHEYTCLGNTVKVHTISIIYIQAADAQHEAEMQQKNEEVRQKNAQLEQIQVLNPPPYSQSFPLPWSTRPCNIIIIAT